MSSSIPDKVATRTETSRSDPAALLAAPGRTRGLWRDTIRYLRKGVASIPNVSMGSMSVREAVWQAYISKGGRDAGEAIVRVARGETISGILRELAPGIRSEVFGYQEGDLRWHFMRSASPLAPVPVGTTR